MRIAFVLHYGGYLRYFDSTIRLLADRGHDVDVYLESSSKQTEGLQALETMGPRVRLGGRFDSRRDNWRHLLRDLRRTAGYVRYLDPIFADATYLRARAGMGLPRLTRPLARLRTLPRPLVRALEAVLLACDRAVPRSEAIDRFVAASAADVFVLSPYVNIASRQIDLARSTEAHGIPTVVAVASWDHLTTKGAALPGPDCFVMWNEIQADEAQTIHGIPRSKIVVTGAQPFDRWFDRQPSRSREAFCARVGLPDSGRFVLFVGSTASISAHDAEQAFVRDWVQAFRRSSDGALRELRVLVRPHPYNSEGWRDVDLSDLGAVAVWPRDGANPVDETNRADYFDSLYYATAVVGVNTSAMIEAAIVGRPVLTVERPEFSHSQAGTLHYSYLLQAAGGFTRVARTFDEHLPQLASAVNDPSAFEVDLRRFVDTFVRPCGITEVATPRVVDAIEKAAVKHPAQQRSSLGSLLLRSTLYPLMRIRARQETAKRRRRDKEHASSPGPAGTTTPAERSHG